MKEFIEHEGRHNVYYKLSLIDSYGRYKNMDKEVLLWELKEAMKRNKRLGTNMSIAECRIINKLLKQTNKDTGRWLICGRVIKPIEINKKISTCLFNSNSIIEYF